MDERIFGSKQGIPRDVSKFFDSGNLDDLNKSGIAPEDQVELVSQIVDVLANRLNYEVVSWVVAKEQYREKLTPFNAVLLISCKDDKSKLHLMKLEELDLLEIDVMKILDILS